MAEGSSQERRRKYARNILSLRKHDNLSLCSVVLAKAFVNTALTLLISDMCTTIQDSTLNVSIRYKHNISLYRDVFNNNMQTVVIYAIKNPEIAQLIIDT